MNRANPPPETFEPAGMRREARDTAVLEMDHRIKNHLQLLASYVRLAVRRGPTAEELAEDLAEKLVAIAGAHDALHRAGGAGFGLARPYLETIVAAFLGSPHRIHVTCDSELKLPAEELAPVGMIVSEAVSNALKHAFPAGRQGAVWVRLEEADGRRTLTIRDNGVGAPEMPGRRISGWGLIETFARQLGGCARLGRWRAGGALVSIVYPATGDRPADVGGRPTCSWPEARPPNRPRGI